MRESRQDFLILTWLALAAVVGMAVSGHSADPATAGQEWTMIEVPGAWEGRSAELASYDGFAWYRCFFKPPDVWVGSGKPDLMSQSVSIQVAEVGDAYELYLNGIKIGGSGEVAPTFKNASGAVERFKVPFGILKQGQYNALAVRVFNERGPGGFKERAPVLAGYHDEAVLKGTWQFRTGDDPAWATAAVAQRPEQAVFDRYSEATTPLVRPEKLSPGKHLAPDEALKSLRTMELLVVDQVLCEPQVAQPLALSFDPRGRLWVVEYRQYPFPAGLKMVSRDKFYRAVYDKIPQPPPHHVHGRDRITIHEDTDGDGRFDAHKTFLDELNIATSTAHGRGGVWVLNPPYLLFYADRNGDDIPDGDPQIHLQGFGLEDTHSVANSLNWGPDGWLYGMQGSTVSSSIKVADGAAPVYCEGPAVWRYHPETKRYEIFAEGGGNPFGLEFDSQGRLYSGHNGSDTRGFHYVQGGYYLKGDGLGKFGGLSNPYAFGQLSYMAHAPTPRFSHALVRYEAESLPAAFRGKLLGVDPLHSNVILADMEPAGATFSTRDQALPLESSDATFRPVEIKVGPDGWVYVADFCEEFIAHGQHFSGQIDPDTGRVYRLRTKDGALLQPFDLSRLSSDALVDLLSHRNKWHRQTALRLLADRQDRSVVAQLLELVRADQGQLALEALWALNLLDQFDESLADALLDHANPQVRLWTVRLLGDAGLVSAALSNKLIGLAARESHAEVRAQLACSAKRLPSETCLGVAAALLGHDDDTNDSFIPLLIWWALESKAATDRAAVLALFERSQIWQQPLARQAVLQQTMRRYASAGTRIDLLACATLFGLAPDQPARAQLLAGFELAFKGRPATGLPPELAAALVRVGGGSTIFRVRSGDAKAINEALDALAAEQSPLATRLEIIETFGEVREPRSVPVLLKLFQDTADERLQSAILTALQNYHDDRIGSAVLARLGALPDTARNVAFSLLVSRKIWARQLLALVEAGTVRPEQVPPDAIRKLGLHHDDTIVARVARHWPSPVSATTAEVREKIARLAQVIGSEAGNPYEGRKRYFEICGKCHTLFGEGGRIGPDLTVQKRDDTQAMLLNVIDPSAEIREGYASYVVITSEGRVVSGFIHDQDQQVVMLRGADGQNVTIARDQIDEMVRQPKSLMPEGILDPLTDEQVRDLFAFLRMSQPVRK